MPAVRAAGGGVDGAEPWSAEAMLPLWRGQAVLPLPHGRKQRKRQQGWRTPKACTNRACYGALLSLSTFPQRSRVHTIVAFRDQ
jgi:hypothetical protein